MDGQPAPATGEPALDRGADHGLDTPCFPLWGSRLIEASAGTGTWTIAAHSTCAWCSATGQLGLCASPLRPADIPVDDLTRAATRNPGMHPRAPARAAIPGSTTRCGRARPARQTARCHTTPLLTARLQRAAWRWRCGRDKPQWQLISHRRLFSLARNAAANTPSTARQPFDEVSPPTSIRRRPEPRGTYRRQHSWQGALGLITRLQWADVPSSKGIMRWC